MDGHGTMLNGLTSCYLSDMLYSGGGCYSAIAARCCVSWRNSGKSLHNLTTRYLMPKVRDRVYTSCVGSASSHGKDSDLYRRCGSDPSIVRWICGTKDRDEALPASLLKRLGIDDITNSTLLRYEVNLSWCIIRPTLRPVRLSVPKILVDTKCILCHLQRL